eukprot:7152097-Ditylum_brightwellii.AAC.2
MFDCEDLGPMKEYVGCKIDYNIEERYIKITQPLLIKSLEDKFDLNKHGHGHIPKTPTEPGTVLNKGEGQVLNKKEHSNYQKGLECSKLNDCPTKT